jgi:acyl-CoA reductase-like NAD-dependent aldehyde dehydrogenase
MAAKKTPSKAGSAARVDDLKVQKTYKLFINGAFPRTESGRYVAIKGTRDAFLANVCVASRKDFRNALVAARAAQQAWQDRSAYNRSQIVYRMAEMLQQKEALFVDEMIQMGYTKQSAKKEFNSGVDLIVYYAGWCDKYAQVYSAVNPVASSHFNFSVPEPTGVVAAIASDAGALIGLFQAILPAICGGNTVVALAAETYPLSAITFGEVLATSDLPAGVVNILTGSRAELGRHFASHMDVNAFVMWDASHLDRLELIKEASENVKRTFFYERNGLSEKGPHMLMDLQEIKTTWHPIDVIAGSKSGY